MAQKDKEKEILRTQGIGARHLVRGDRESMSTESNTIYQAHISVVFTSWCWIAVSWRDLLSTKVHFTDDSHH